MHTSTAPESTEAAGDRSDSQLRVSSEVGGEAALEALRSFHHTGRRASEPQADLVPALFHRYRRPGNLRYAFPLVFDVDADESSCESLSEVLRRLVPSNEDDRILHANLARLERAIRRHLRDRGAMGPLSGAVAEATPDLLAELGLREESHKLLEASLARLVERVPEGLRVIGFGPEVPFVLFWSAARALVANARRELASRVRVLLGVLEDLAEVEAGHQPATAARLSDALGESAGGLVDSDSLAQVLARQKRPNRQVEGRRQRLEELARRLRAFLEAEPGPSLILIHPPGLRLDAGLEGVVRAEHEDPIAEAVRRFDDAAQRLADVVMAIRAAQLEARNAYDPVLHDAWLSALDWSSLARDELDTLPVIAGVLDARAASTHQLAGLSSALRTRRPIRLLTAVRPELDPSANAPDTSQGGARAELGLIGVAHQQALVHQTSAAQPDHCLRGFQRAMRSGVPSLHVLVETPGAEGDDEEAARAWLLEQAACEGRAHPRFVYDPTAGRSWADRFELGDQPALDEPWSAHPLDYVDAEGRRQQMTVAFTFADYALLAPALRDQLLAVSAEVDARHLQPLAAYLEQLPASHPTEQLPFVWSCDEQGRLVRLVVSEALCLATRERLAFWRTLQEYGGRRSPHVEHAVAEVQREAAEELARVRSELETAHAIELERVRRTAGEEVLDRLASALVQAGPEAWRAPTEARATIEPAPASAPEPASMGPTAAATSVPAPEPPAAADDEDDDAAEPWIESALCTSCGDCMAINSRLFVYNGNKQAVIGDPKSGTFLELVMAAEKCPSRCIHPGQPLDESEPNLDALRARAEPFN